MFLLLRRGLWHYRRSNLAVILGVATAVAVLAGALVVGDSVRLSLRRLALERLGNTESVITSVALFREELAAKIPDSCPLLRMEGLVTHQESRRRATQVAIYGVDDRFWQFHSRAPVPLNGRETALSVELARELGAHSGDTLLLRLQKPSDIPSESLFGKKESDASVIRLTVKMVLSAENFGEFSLRPQQGPVRALYLPMAQLQRELETRDRINVILTGNGAGDPRAKLRENFELEDIGLRVRAVPGDSSSFQVDSANGVLDEKAAEAASKLARQMDLRELPVLTYLANSLRAGNLEIPYSLVAATDLSAFSAGDDPDAIVLNQWAARDLRARRGQQVEMTYYLWHTDGTLTTEKASFRVARIVPIAGLAADRRLTPEYPGITDANDMSDWDPPFPMDLSRIGPHDENYWHRYRTTPKAWIRLERGQQLWQSRFGKISTLRLTAARGRGLDAAIEYRRRLRDEIDPFVSGMTLVPVRRLGEEAARGATDFGEYFVYFSFFLVVSALLLAGLFFRLSVEQRASEVGVLEAVGFRPGRIQRLFLLEAAVLAGCGAILGTGGAIAYAWLILKGLGTWWVGAVGTRNLVLVWSPKALAYGVAGGVAASFGATLWGLRILKKMSARQLISGGRGQEPGLRKSRAMWIGAAAMGAGVDLVIVGIAGIIPPAGAFFGAGALILIGSLALLRGILAANQRRLVTGAGIPALAQFALRNAAWRPGRTVLSAALIASATFLIVSLEAFRRDPQASGGAYPLMAESVRPLFHNPNSEEGREALNLDTIEGIRFVPFRLRPGDDASCLNLYQPENPRILGAPPGYLREAKINLPDTPMPDGAIPAAADANSLTYVLHKNIGDELVIAGDSGSPVRLRLVAALEDSIFQSELVIGEANFLRVFPRQQGFRFFLIDAPREKLEEVSAQLEDALADHGFDVVSTAERLAAFHRVENTYLSTFQTLGGFGLLLGTVGLAAVLFRNVAERRRELALLSALGYRQGLLTRLVLGENLLLVVAGLGAGTLAAAVAIAPVISARHTSGSLLAAAGLLSAVAATGLVTTIAAALQAMRLPLLSSLREG